MSTFVTHPPNLFFPLIAGDGSLENTKEKGEMKLEMVMYYFFGGILVLSPFLTALFFLNLFASFGSMIWWVPLVFLGLIGLGIALATPFFIRAERLRRKLKKGG